MESDFNLHTEVRLADLLALLEANTCQAYLCHYVAYTLRDEISKHRNYRAYHKEVYVEGADDTYTQQRNTAIPYYFLVRDINPIRHHDLQSQVVPQFNALMVKYRPDLEEIINPGISCLSENVMRKFWMDESTTDPYRQVDSDVVRLGMVRKILEHDPEAVLTIQL